LFEHCKCLAARRAVLLVVISAIAIGLLARPVAAEISDVQRTAIQNLRSSVHELEYLEIYGARKALALRAAQLNGEEQFEAYKLLAEYAYWVDDAEGLRQNVEWMMSAVPSERLEEARRLCDMLLGYADIVDGDYAEGVASIEAALAAAINEGENYSIGLGYSLLGAAVSYYEHYYEGLQYIQDAQKYIPDTPMGERLKISIFLTLAYIHTEQGEVSSAVDYYQRVLDLSQKSGWAVDLATILYNVAFVLSDLGEYELTESLYQELGALYTRMGEQAQMFYVHYGLAVAYYYQGRYGDALTEGLKGVQLNYDDDFFNATLYQTISASAAWLGDASMARDYLDRSYKIFAEYPEYDETSWSLENLRGEALIALAEGKPRKALEIFEDFHQRNAMARSKAFSKDVAGLRTRMESSFDLEHQRELSKMQIAQISLENQQRINLLVGLILLVMVIALFFQYRARKKLKQSMLEVERASRAKSDFLAQMSHELRTPLNAVIGFSEMMKNKVFGEVGVPQYKEYVALINQSGRHLLRIINDILDISKVESGRVELTESWFDVSDLVAKTVTILTNRAERAKIQLRIVSENDDHQLYADERIVQQILFNIVTNAIKFSHADSEVLLMCSLTKEGQVLVEVEDFGIGMSEADLQEAMQPFGQIQRVLTRGHEGSGLGLPLVKAYMELHDGHLILKSELGKGTTVSLVFPKSRTGGAGPNKG